MTIRRGVAAERIVTTRMVGERLRPDHHDELSRLLRDTRVAALAWPFDQPPSEADVAAGLAAKIDHWERHGFGFWLLRDRASGTMVGRGGLQYTFAADLYDVEVAWAIVPERWGQGLATEMAQAALDVAFQQLELPSVVALTQPHNVASRRVMEKTGFGFECDIVHAGLPHLLYRRARASG